MLAIIDSRSPNKIRDALKDRGYEVLGLPPHPALPSPVASHPDMLLFFDADRILCTKEYQRIAKRELEVLSKAAQKPIVCVEETVANVYPQDILLNAATVGEYVFCLAEYTAGLIRDREHYTVRSVRQGYAKCSTVPIDNRSLITSDPSIAKVAKEQGLSVLRTDAVPIELPGYDTGFLGGATSYAPYGSTDEIFFCGNFMLHPQAEQILAFCKERGKTPVSLSEDPLMDLGTVFLIS